MSKLIAKRIFKHTAARQYAGQANRRILIVDTSGKRELHFHATKGWRSYKK